MNLRDLKYLIAVFPASVGSVANIPAPRPCFAARAFFTRITQIPPR